MSQSARQLQALALLLTGGLGTTSTFIFWFPQKLSGALRTELTSPLCVRFLLVACVSCL